MELSAHYKQLSVLIVEDDDVTRGELNEIMMFYFGSVHTAVNGCEGYDIIKKYQPDIVISDIHMPCMSGIEMFEEAKALNKKGMFFFATAIDRNEYLHKAIDLKVDGYLIKPFRMEKFLQKVCEHYADLELLTAAGQGEAHRGLSKREYEVFLDIAKGLKPQAIADKYGIRPKTVGTYRTRILDKMHLCGNADLVRYAVDNGLI